MKNIIQLLLPIFWANLLFASTPSTITDVCVYEKGAKISRSATIPIPAGLSTIELSNISKNVKSKTIQIDFGNPNIELLDIKFQTHLVKDESISKELQLIRDSMAVVTKDKKWLEQEILVLKEEEKLLLLNNKTYSNANGVDTEELKKLSDYYRKRLTEIRRALFDVDFDKAALVIEENRFKRLISQEKFRRKVGTIYLQVQAKKAISTKLNFSYFASSASWLPVYDIRSAGMGEDLNLTYKARIYNSTGFDWENVNLSLSSAAPSTFHYKPQLDILFVDFCQATRQDTVITFDPETYEEQIQVVQYDVAENKIQQLPTSFLYQIKEKHSIPSDREKHYVEIREENIPALYEYFCVPRLKNEVFLLANILDFGKYDLLPGEANIFFNNTYVGESYINGTIASDTLQLSLGQDNSIVVNRLEKDFSSEKLIGINKKKRYDYQIKVKNNKSIAINIRILDQIPISTQKNIEVKLLEKSKSKHETTTGKLTWILDVPANQSQNMEFSYSLKFPKEKGLKEYY